MNKYCIVEYIWLDKQKNLRSKAKHILKILKV